MIHYSLKSSEEFTRTELNWKIHLSILKQSNAREETIQKHGDGIITDFKMRAIFEIWYSKTII